MTDERRADEELPPLARKLVITQGENGFLVEAVRSAYEDEHTFWTFQDVDGVAAFVAEHYS